MSHDQRHSVFVLLAVCLGAALLSLGAALAFSPTPVALAQDGDDEPEPAADTESSVNNSYCAICHSQPGRVMTLADGSVLNLYVPPALIADSAHGTNSSHPLGCIDCHGEDIFPHSGPSPAGVRAYRIETSQLCSDCHNTLLADSAHLEAIARGNLEAATCVDCHGAHDVPNTENQPTLVAAVCGDCHTESFDEWAVSPHANMGSLGCAVCHLPHGQQMRITDITALCENCHQAPEDIYVHAKHLDSEYEVTCASCHMGLDPGVELISDSHEPTDHRMVVETRACNACHEELEQSGVWAELVGSDERLTIERDSLRQQIATLEQQIARGEGSSGGGIDYIQLIQGLIVGLGLGAVVALILIPRLGRNAQTVIVEEHPVDDYEQPDEHEHH